MKEKRPGSKSRESIARGLVDASKFNPANPADVKKYEATMEEARKAAALIEHQQEQAEVEQQQSAEKRQAALISLGRQPCQMFRVIFLMKIV
jgi:hypothetical protein